MTSEHEPDANAQIVDPDSRWMQFEFPDTPKTAPMLRGVIVWVDWPADTAKGQCSCTAKYPVITKSLPQPLRGMIERSPGGTMYVCKCNGTIIE